MIKDIKRQQAVASNEQGKLDKKKNDLENEITNLNSDLEDIKKKDRLKNQQLLTKGGNEDD